MAQVIVLVSVHKEDITHFESISLRQCCRVLARHPMRLICPEGLDVSEYCSLAERIDVDYFPAHWFRSYQKFARFKILPFLYERYADYEFILFYELDSFVFRDDLEYWCAQDYDYIGAPWFEGFINPSSDTFVGVGNGGFSLRKTKVLLRALHNFSYIYPYKKLFNRFFSLRFAKKLEETPHLLASLAGIRNNSYWLFNDCPDADDIFWGLYMRRNFKWFKVAPPGQALRFSFELKPRLLFQMNEGKLPFGCHAWERYDFDFWRPFIEKEGYRLSEEPSLSRDSKR
jgi:hypothetical protein